MRWLVFALACYAAAGEGPAPPSLLAANKVKQAPEVWLAAAAQVPVRPRANQIGEHRILPPQDLSKGAWITKPRVWRLALRSRAAAAMRVHFLDFQVGQGRVWVHNGKDWFGPYTGGGLYGDGDFWSHVTPGDRLVIEYAPAKGGERRPPPFRVREVSHLRVDPNR
jgi:hypothetical protein